MLYQCLSPTQRLLYSIAIAKLALKEIDDVDTAAHARIAIERVEAWCQGESVEPEEIANLIHDETDRGLDLYSQEAHVKGWPSAVAIDTILYAVVYIAWRINILKPPVMELFDNACEEMLSEMEDFACSCNRIRQADLQQLAITFAKLN
jgi:hypothetical protein